MPRKRTACWGLATRNFNPDNKARNRLHSAALLPLDKMQRLVKSPTLTGIDTWSPNPQPLTVQTVMLRPSEYTFTPSLRKDASRPGDDYSARVVAFCTLSLLISPVKTCDYYTTLTSTHSTYVFVRMWENSTYFPVYNINWCVYNRDGEFTERYDLNLYIQFTLKEISANAA